MLKAASRNSKLKLISVAHTTEIYCSLAFTMSREFNEKRDGAEYCLALRGHHEPVKESSSLIERSAEHKSDLSQKLRNIDTQVERLTSLIREAEKNLDAYKREMAPERERVLRELVLRNHYFEHVDNWEDVKVTDLEKHTVFQLKFLYYMRTGDILQPLRYSGERVHRYLMDEADYKGYHIYELTKLQCKYCHSISHEKEGCPILLAKKCMACGKHGHDQTHCNMTMAEYIRRKTAPSSK